MSAIQTTPVKSAPIHDPMPTQDPVPADADAKPHFANTLSLLIERLDFIKLDPKQVLVITPYPGVIEPQLKQYYPNAEYSILSQDFEKFPLKKRHFDLIFSHWLSPHFLLTNSTPPVPLPEQYELLFYLIRHLLSDTGLLLFSSLGSDTVLELDNGGQDFPHMPLLGDVLLKTGFADPVMDREQLVAPKVELLFGHAWGAQESTPSTPDKDGNVYISVDSIKQL